jgi:hypothetical protein
MFKDQIFILNMGENGGYSVAVESVQETEKI